MTFAKRDLFADLDTPVSAYVKLRAEAPYSFLLESVEGKEKWATYSIIGVGAEAIFSVKNGVLTEIRNGVTKTYPGKDPLEALREAAKRHGFTPQDDGPPFVGGMFGFLSYDAVRSFEPVLGARQSSDVPDALFIVPELLAVFNNRRHSLSLYAKDTDVLDDAAARLLRAPPSRQRAGRFENPTALDSREAYEHAVRRAQEHIKAGDIIQAVLSRRFEMPRVCDAFDVYRGLRVINPSPYMYFLRTPDLTLAGASPEVMVRVSSGTMMVRPIAGTRPRGRDDAHDQALAQELIKDEKERAEHIMLVDLGRNDIGRVAKPGSVRVTDLMTVETYSHVMHIVSEVQGVLKPELDAFDALRAAFPAGTLSGAPKVRAMQIIDTLEERARGVYGGAVGYFAPNGDADFGIAIRTLMARPDRFIIQAGAGIVEGSVPSAEADETEHKANAVLRAIQWGTNL